MKFFKNIFKKLSLNNDDDEEAVFQQNILVGPRGDSIKFQYPNIISIATQSAQNTLGKLLFSPRSRLRDGEKDNCDSGMINQQVIPVKGPPVDSGIFILSPVLSYENEIHVAAPTTYLKHTKESASQGDVKIPHTHPEEKLLAQEKRHAIRNFFAKSIVPAKYEPLVEELDAGKAHEGQEGIQDDPKDRDQNDSLVTAIPDDEGYFESEGNGPASPDATGNEETSLCGEESLQGDTKQLIKCDYDDPEIYDSDPEDEANRKPLTKSQKRFLFIVHTIAVIFVLLTSSISIAFAIQQGLIKYGANNTVDKMS